MQILIENSDEILIENFNEISVENFDAIFSKICQNLMKFY